MREEKMVDGISDRSIPTPFIWRRVHSLTGLWLTLYLVEHLIVNSQAALWIGEDGSGFIRFVNFLESLPYLQIVEIGLIGIPLLVHGGWGIKRALTAKANAWNRSGRAPSLSQYGRNRAFSWQRITAWILLIGIIAHVVQMRFLDYPRTAQLGGEKQSMVKITFDEGLYTLAARLKATLYTPEEIAEMAKKIEGSPREELPIQDMPLGDGKRPIPFQVEKQQELNAIQQREEEKGWVETLSAFRLKTDQVVAVTTHPGPAMLLSLRDTFKSPLMAIFYTIFVLAAAFHAFNGFWTFLISWGVILSMSSQKIMSKMSWVGTLLLSLLGLVAIWCSYWINLRW